MYLHLSFYFKRQKASIWITQGIFFSQIYFINLQNKLDISFSFWIPCVPLPFFSLCSSPIARVFQYLKDTWKKYMRSDNAKRKCQKSPLSCATFQKSPLESFGLLMVIANVSSRELSPTPTKVWLMRSIVFPKMPKKQNKTKKNDFMVCIWSTVLHCVLSSHCQFVLDGWVIVTLTWIFNIFPSVSHQTV